MSVLVVRASRQLASFHFSLACHVSGEISRIIGILLYSRPYLESTGISIAVVIYCNAMLLALLFLRTISYTCVMEVVKSFAIFLYLFSHFLLKNNPARQVDRPFNSSFSSHLPCCEAQL